MHYRALIANQTSIGMEPMKEKKDVLYNMFIISLKMFIKSWSKAANFRAIKAKSSMALSSLSVYPYK